MIHLIRMTSIIVVLTLLLAVFVVPTQASEPASISAEDGGDTALVCLALVGSAALLAGAMWMGTLRRVLS